jgi:hypothetical protein
MSLFCLPLRYSLERQGGVSEYICEPRKIDELLQGEGRKHAICTGFYFYSIIKGIYLQKDEGIFVRERGIVVCD